MGTGGAMETAAGNPAGAMTGFMGMNMAGNAMGGGFNAAQQFYSAGVQQQQQQMVQQQTQQLLAMEDGGDSPVAMLQQEREL